MSKSFECNHKGLPLRRGVALIITEQFHSAELELSLCAGSNPTPAVSEIRDDENL